MTKPFFNAVIATLLGGFAAFAAEDVDFAKDIQPILAENCFACHGMDEETRAADLRLDEREGAIDRGAIVEGDPESSSLIERIVATDEDILMPPPSSHKKLTDVQKELLHRWIAEGAEYSEHWSLVAPKKPVPPEVENESWVNNEIDRFVLAKLEANQLQPAEEASPSVFFRRLNLDVTGLLPLPEDAATFVRDYEASGDDAVSKWIDRLMERPTWGEHRARYWLDAARYADTHGMHFDNYREMWPYRDWVIRAFNSNQRFDQFVIEQLAGDLLESPTREQKIATGFQRCGMTTNEGGTIEAENFANYASERVQTFGWVFLGLTTNCCQCHDHKFDPISMKDYYSLAAFFRNTTQPAKDGNSKDGKGPVIVVPAKSDAARWDALQSELAGVRRKMNRRRRQSDEDFEKWLTSVDTSKLDTVPPEGLQLHLPLNEGSGETVANSGPSAAWQKRRLLAVEDGAPMKDVHAVTRIQAAEKAGAIARMNRESFEVPNPNWQPEGVIGSSLKLTKGEPISLKGHGDFSVDRPFSAGCWTKTNQEANGAILARMNVKRGDRGWDVLQNQNEFSTHLIDKWRESAIKVITKDERVKFGQWQHVLVTWDGKLKARGLKIYIDGKRAKTKVVVDQLEKGANIQIKEPLLIGSRSHGGVPFDGSVQDVVLYDRELTAKEIQKIATTAMVRRAARMNASELAPELRKPVQQYFLDTDDAAYKKLAKQHAVLKSERDQIKERSPITHVQVEKKTPAMAHVLMRGAYDKPGEEVAAAPPAALHKMPADAPANRLGLAKWVVDPNNPLTARVTVNRFWQELMGQGVVATSEDFGVMGTLPSNQDLLDWMAVDFQESGWDVKRFFKQMMMSSAYRQAAVITPEKLAKDRDNAWLSRGPRFRMDAEMLRDNALRASGLLSEEMYGYGVKPYQPSHLWDVVGIGGGDTRQYNQDTGSKLYRRSLYSFWKRMSPPPNLEAFNAPNREVCTVRRERTNTPMMALVALNDPQFVEAARAMAQDVLQDSSEPEAVLDQIAERTICRAWSEPESKIILDSLAKYREHFSGNPGDAKKLLSVGERTVDDSLDSTELASWTMVCNEILNLDEVLNK